MRRRTILSCMVLAGTTLAAVPVGGTAPAGAQAVEDWTIVAGNFFGDGRDESFLYQEGTAPDALRTLTNGGIPGGDATSTVVPYTVNGSYRPFTGDFDGDNFDEIFWYGPGSRPDFIWHFADSRHFRTQVVSVSGNYTPLPGDFNGDNIDDIFWYGPGGAPDALWLNRRGDASPISLARTVNGNFRPVVASIGKDATDDIVWYRPGTGTDVVWDFTRLTRTHTQFLISVNGSYNPVALDSFGDGPRGDDIWWMAPGAAADPFWDYENGVRVDPPGSQLPVVTNWKVTVGDYFGDGMEDADMNTLTSEVIRDFTIINGEFVFVDYISTAAAAMGGDLGDKSSSAGEPQQRAR
jgi:hypothetical protein